MLLRAETSTFWSGKRKKKPSGSNIVSVKNSVVCSKVTGKTEELKFKAQSYDVGNNKKMKGSNR